MEVEELAAIVTNGFKDLSARMEGGFEQVDSRLTTVDENVHRTRMLVEQLTSDVKQIAEGVEMHHTQLRRHVEDTDRRFDDIESVFRNYRARRKRTTARAGPSR